MGHNFYKQYKVFISSPGDVAKERKIVDTIISKINDSVGETLKINIKIENWEKLPPETDMQSIQDRLNQKIEDCNFFLLILYKRYGCVEKGQTISNTEREINTIIEHINHDKKKTILSYFKELKKNNDPGDQEQKIIDLRNRLATNNWFYSLYNNESDFERKLTHDLYRILLRMSMSSFKIEQLKKFWRIGKVDGQPIPKISIVYPPVPKSRMTNGLTTNIWQKRLLPHIFYEDHKALHKILKNLSMVGHQDYKVYSKYNLPQDIDQTNIIWICLPRLKQGLDELRKQNNCTFNIIVPKSDVSEPYIEWKQKNGEKIIIKSPLRKYLEKQRSAIDPESDWDLSLNNILVKDYAIIARFNRSTTQYYNPGTEDLKAFYIAGIHGLGTWGATWFIDRKYGVFKDTKLENDIQILVEVEYINGRIHNVIDVSNNSQDYFDNENKINTIKNNIKQYKEK